MFSAVTCVLLLLAARTWVRNYDWRNVETLYETGLKVRACVRVCVCVCMCVHLPP